VGDASKVDEHVVFARPVESQQRVVPTRNSLVKHGKYLSRLCPETEWMSYFAAAPASGDTLEALIILAIAIGIAGVAILILFAKDKI